MGSLCAIDIRSTGFGALCLAAGVKRTIHGAQSVTRDPFAGIIDGPESCQEVPVAGC